MRVFIGWDSNEQEAYEVAERTLLEHSGLRAEPLKLKELTLNRMIDRRVTRKGVYLWDHISQAPQSTEFALTRFLVPFLCREGWALFTDCDVVFLDDARKIMEHADPDKAVMVVKHDYVSRETSKMGGAPQTNYGRKNWSSVILWNCSHPAHSRIDLNVVNRFPGKSLHQFCWLADAEIGELPAGWNWLVGVEPKPSPLHVAHFTLGGPWIQGWEGAEYDEVWLDAQRPAANYGTG